MGVESESETSSSSQESATGCCFRVCGVEDLEDGEESESRLREVFKSGAPSVSRYSVRDSFTSIPCVAWRGMLQVHEVVGLQWWLFPCGVSVV